MNLTKLFDSLGRGCVRHGRLILGITAVIVALSAIAASRLRVETDIAALLPPDNPTAASFNRITDAFDSTSTLIVVIQAENQNGTGRDQLIKAAEAFTEGIQKDAATATLIRSIQFKSDRPFFETWGFMLQDEEELAESKRLFANTHLIPLLRETNDLVEEKLADGSDEEVEGPEGEDDSYALMSRFAIFAERFRSALESEKKGSEQAAEAWLYGEEYFIDPEGHTLILIVKPNFDLGDRNKLSALSGGAHRIGSEIVKTHGSAVKTLRFSFTGDVENEADEERAIQSDLFYPSIIAILLIVVLFLFSFNRKRSILFAIISLLIGLLADLAFAALAVGKIDMITSSFGALLIGLGIDFGIHIVSRYDELINSGNDKELAMGEVLSSLGLPIAIGGLTTAAAFYSLILSDSLSFRHFGLIAGTGIIATLLSSFIVLPAFLGVFCAKPVKQRIRKVMDYTLPAKIAFASRRFRIPIIAVAVILLIIAVPLSFKNSFEYDMRKIGPEGTKAQEAEGMVAHSFGVSTWPQMLSVDKLDEARDLVERFKETPLVRRVEYIGDYLPTAEEQEKRLVAIANIAAQDGRSALPADFIWDENAIQELAGEIQRLEWNMVELGDLAAASLGEASLPVRKRNAMIREIFGAEVGEPGEEVFQKLIASLKALAPEEGATRLAEIDEHFAATVDQHIRRLTSVDRPMELSDIPASIKDDFVSRDASSFLIVIQGMADAGSERNLVTLSKNLTQVHPEVTGTITLGLELSREILQEAQSMGLLVAFIVIVFVGLAFKSITKTLLVSLTLAFGILWMFAIYPLVGQFNIINALALPLIIGIGIDYCVHILSALKEGDFESFRKTVKAVSLSALTTGIGFGSLALVGSFRGIADLGAILTIGIFCCYVAAMILIPAIYSGIHRMPKTNKE